MDISEKWEEGEEMIEGEVGEEGEEEEEEQERKSEDKNGEVAGEEYPLSTLGSSRSDSQRRMAFRLAGPKCLPARKREKFP